jgi:hypothetical protein
MRILRLPLIVLIFIALDLAAPFAVGSTQALDEVTTAVHRPRNNKVIHLVRDLPSSKAEGRLQVASIHRLRTLPGFRRPLRGLEAAPRPRKIPAPVIDSPDSREDH